MNYPGNIDAECIELCNAINSIDGLQTCESCCGHGKRAMRIWIVAEKVKNLMTIGRILDRRYSIILHDWKCEVNCTDGKFGVIFFLHSGNTIGQQAYNESKILAENIRIHLAHPEYMKLYNTADNFVKGDIQ
jgi:hypothetical protein